MATNFPTSLDSLTNPTSTDTLASPSHSGQHADANDAIEALEAKVGVDGSAVTTSHSYKIAGLEGKQYVTLASDSQLSSERVLTAGTGISVTDAGAGSTVTVATSAILPTIVDAKGDLIAGTANDTVARIAVGSNNQVLTADSAQTAGVKWATPVTVATDTLWDAKGDLAVGSGADTAAKLTVGSNGDMLVADSSATSGLRWQGQSNSGRNAIINGGFDVWQRGTSTTTGAVYLADRWVDNTNMTSYTMSQQSCTSTEWTAFGTETPKYFIRHARTGGSYAILEQRIEDVRTFANKTVTLSYWAKVSTGTVTNEPSIVQIFGTGGSTEVGVNGSQVTLTTSWQRFSHTITLGSIASKTVGTNSYLAVRALRHVSNTGATIDFWGVQLELGSVATQFEELPYETTLRKCQRYYHRAIVDTVGDHFGSGFNKTTTVGMFFTPFPVAMRVAPTALEQSGTAANYAIAHANTSTACSSVPTFESATVNGASTNITVASGLTAGQGSMAKADNTAAYLAWSAEL